MKKCLPLIIACVALLAACRNDNSPPPQQVSGYQPIYAPKVADADIRLVADKPVEQKGKTLLAPGRFYQLEPGKGIHVLNISNLQQISKAGFINIPGAHDIAVRGDQLFTNTYNDLLVLDVANLQQIKILQRAGNAFSLQSLEIPPKSGYFECVDASRGIVIGWQEATLQSPHCRY